MIKSPLLICRLYLTFTEPPGKVRFQQEQLEHHDSEIVIRPESETSLVVHLGFLQVLLVIFIS